MGIYMWFTWNIHVTFLALVIFVRLDFSLHIYLPLIVGMKKIGKYSEEKKRFKVLLARNFNVLSYRPSKLSKTFTSVHPHILMFAYFLCTHTHSQPLIHTLTHTYAHENLYFYTFFSYFLFFYTQTNEQLSKQTHIIG